MLEIKGGIYIWGEEALEGVWKRIMNGDCITMNSKKKKAFINYYVGTNTLEIPYRYATILAQLRIIKVESGNWDTHEEHLYINK